MIYFFLTELNFFRNQRYTSVCFFASKNMFEYMIAFFINNIVLWKIMVEFKSGIDFNFFRNKIKQLTITFFSS
ncbi:MAG: hypothetical protein EBW49_04315 [Betaproteobacteria bacterium]|nr:hypothetical protein [Betaproteobacteria bacterium]